MAKASSMILFYCLSSEVVGSQELSVDNTVLLDINGEHFVANPSGDQDENDENALENNCSS